jgi:NAD(P)-dependent dehydrogenase (short-subunit alcohol dehydrogenase family)
VAAVRTETFVAVNSRLLPVSVTFARWENPFHGKGVKPEAVARRGLTSKTIGERVKELSGKVAFVTGSAGGIGLGIARACAEAGMKIVLSDIDGVALEQSAAELAKETGAEVMAVPLDVTDRDDWARAAREVPEALGPVQLLVNNAGVSTLGMRFDEVGPELWDRVISINLTGVYNGVHYFLDGMRVAGGGHIVNTSSMGGLMGFPTLSPYSASKFAVVGLSEALSGELAESGIGVSVLCPGGVRSRPWRRSGATRNGRLTRSQAQTGMRSRRR